MIDLSRIGAEYVIGRLEDLTTEIVQVSPVEFSEEHRYLPPSVTQFPGYINFDRSPHLIEPLEWMDVRCPGREGAFMKGHQIGASLILESTVMYFAGHIRTVPCMYVTADGGLSSARIEHNFIPMFRQSGMDIFRSADTGNSRKKGVTKEYMQWIGGGYLVPFGAKNADKFRQFSMAVLIMDEVGAWVDLKDGDPVDLLKDRTSGFEGVNKIMIVSTPTSEGSCKMHKAFLRGDQRIYKCRCLDCGYPQALRWSGKNRDTGREYGMKWDYNSEGQLDIQTVRYECSNCGRPHTEDEKFRFITRENSFWEPTATSVSPTVRSWHAPTMVSKIQPWYKSVFKWLDAYDRETNRVKDRGKLRVFYNNVLGWPFREDGGRVRFEMVSAHRRHWYTKGQIPNKQISRYCDSEILFLTCTVDVHGHNLAIAVWGWSASTSGFGCNLVDYQRIYDDSEQGCLSMDSPAWDSLRAIIDEGEWTADDGKKYRLVITLIDANWGESTATVVEFCQQWESGVFPIMGRERPARAQSIIEFAEFTTQAGTTGYRIFVDYYKDRIAPVLRRTWTEPDGKQKPYTFNAPMDTTDKELKELTREYKRAKTMPNGDTIYEWHRPNGAENELWDLMVYGHASVEIIAKIVCIQEHGLEAVEWADFWEYCKSGVFYE